MKSVTIERTSKRYKAAGCLSGALLVASVVWTLCARSHAELVHSDPSYTPPIVLASLAALLYVYAKIGSWWRHG